MYKIMFSAGETSGDMHGANLAKALKISVVILKYLVLAVLKWNKLE